MVVALSIRQPWLDLILQGRKTVEVRSWKTNYRGPLLLHASRKVDLRACTAYGYHPRDLETGGILGVAELEDCIPFSLESWSSLAAAHLNLGGFASNLVGWIVRNPKQVTFMPCPGRLGLFNVPSVLLEESTVLLCEPEE